LSDSQVFYSRGLLWHHAQEVSQEQIIFKRHTTKVGSGLVLPFLYVSIREVQHTWDYPLKVPEWEGRIRPSDHPLLQIFRICVTSFNLSLAFLEDPSLWSSPKILLTKVFNQIK
jgi:hypothetical protein